MFLKCILGSVVELTVSPQWFCLEPCFWTVMEAHGAPSELLLQHPWLSVSISDCQLLAKSWFGETAYHILLTDTHSVWEESMDSAAIQKRAQVCQQEDESTRPDAKQINAHFLC